MADRKARSVTFRTPHRIGLGDLKSAIETVIQDLIVVFQDLGDDVYLLELESRADAEELVNNGFDIEEFHIDCSPPHGRFLNVSVMGLRSYVEDEEVKLALSEYGELKSDVIRLKYKADHELAGLENGNRLVKMILDKPSIPYSLRVGGEWCRIIHNNQQPVCMECNELGHTKRNCPKIQCRVCKQLGHMSYNCELWEEQDGEAPDRQPETKDEQAEATDRQLDAAEGSGFNVNGDVHATKNQTENKKAESRRKEEMDYDDRAQNLKRQHVTDSDSDGVASVRRTKLKPAPNLSTVRREKKPAKDSAKPISK